MKKLRGLPGLRKMAKFSLSAGEVMIGKVGANLKGIDLAARRRGAAAGADRSGKVEDLGKPAPLRQRPQLGRRRRRGGRHRRRRAHHPGRRARPQLRAKVGDCISVLVPFAGDETRRPARRPTRSQVVGLFRLGFHEYDTRLAYVSLEDARKLGGAAAAPCSGSSCASTTPAGR